MSLRALAIALFSLCPGLLPGIARADGCDALTAKMVRATGASLAGRVGPLAVFRAADAERMSLVCSPREMLFRSAYRQPNRYYFVLIGLAGQALTGAPAEAVETLAQRLHQDTLLTGEAQEGRAGPASMRCEAGDRPTGFDQGALCRITPVRVPGRRGLSARG